MSRERVVMTRGGGHTARLVCCAVMSLLAACTGELTGDQMSPDEERDATMSGEMGPRPVDDQGRPIDLGGEERDLDITPDQGVPSDDMGVEADADMAMMPTHTPGPWDQYLDPEYNPNLLDQDALFSGGADDDRGAITLGRLRRIESLEWIRDTGRWVTTRSSGGSRAEQNPFEVAQPHGYSTYRTTETLNEGALSQYLNVINESAYSWSRPASGYFGTGRLPTALMNDPAYKCLAPGADANPPDAACIESFVRFYLREGVYFRTPTEEEVSALKDFAVDIFGEVAPGSYDDAERKRAIEVIVSTAWMSSGALFRPELGEGTPDAEGRVALTATELAQSVAYALGKKAPGAPVAYIAHGGPGERRQWVVVNPELGHMHAIEQAGEDGTILDRQVLADLIRQHAGGIDLDRKDLPIEELIIDARSKRGEFWMGEGISRFFREWLEVDDFPTRFKDTVWATSKYDVSGQTRHIQGSYDHLQGVGEYSYEPLYLQQLDDMIARIVVEDQQVFEQLMTSRTFYTPRGVLNPDTNVARGQKPQYVYNIELEHDGSREQRWQILPDTERSGVLTHPVWLAAHSDNFENGTGIIYRGKWLRERLLCGHVPPVTSNINAALVPGAGKSGRQRVDESTAPPQCQGCHGLMNSLGKPFEIYNHGGFVRAIDNGGAPDGSSTLQNMPQSSGLDGVMVSDAIDMTQRLADSQYVRRCFIRQTFRYFMGRPETMSDGATLRMMEDTYQMTNGSFIELLVALMTSDAYLYRLHASVLDP